MTVMMNCPSCGAPIAPGARFCGTCGTPTVLPPAYALYASVAPPHDRTAMIVVIVIAVVVVSTVGISALLYVMVSGLITNGPPSPIAVGVVVGKSSDGTNWTLTFTGVPSNMNPSVTYLSLMTGSGAIAMPQTALSSMGGGMMMMSSGMGSLWVHYSGTPGSMIAPGDTISIGTMTSMGASTTGFQGRMLFAASLVWSGTLQ